jgi:hypothetical protein
MARSEEEYLQDHQLLVEFGHHHKSHTSLQRLNNSLPQTRTVIKVQGIAPRKALVTFTTRIMMSQVMDPHNMSGRNRQVPKCRILIYCNKIPVIDGGNRLMST